MRGSNEPAAPVPQSPSSASPQRPTAAPAPHPHAQTGSPDNTQPRQPATKAPHPATVPSKPPAPEDQSHALPYAGYAQPHQSAASRAAAPHSSPESCTHKRSGSRCPTAPAAPSSHAARRTPSDRSCSRPAYCGRAESSSAYPEPPEYTYPQSGKRYPGSRPYADSSSATDTASRLPDRHIGCLTRRVIRPASPPARPLRRHLHRSAVFRCIELFSPAWTLVFTVLAHDDPLTPKTTIIAAATTAKPLPLNIRIHTPLAFDLRECKPSMRFANCHSPVTVYPTHTRINDVSYVTLVSYSEDSAYQITKSIQINCLFNTLSREPAQLPGHTRACAAAISSIAIPTDLNTTGRPFLSSAAPFSSSPISAPPSAPASKISPGSLLPASRDFHHHRPPHRLIIQLPAIRSHRPHRTHHRILLQPSPLQDRHRRTRQRQHHIRPRTASSAVVTLAPNLFRKPAAHSPPTGSKPVSPQTLRTRESAFTCDRACTPLPRIPSTFASRRAS